MKKGSPEQKKHQAMLRRAHYLKNKQSYLDHAKRTHLQEMALRPNNECAWCGEPFPRVQYGPRKFCSIECRRLSQKNTILQREYGITLDRYYEMLEEQNHRCALCQRKSKLTLAVEHSHITGTIRGLCCMTCNRDIIGALDGDHERIRKAAAFLEKAADDLQKFLERNTVPEPGLPEALPVETKRSSLVPMRIPKKVLKT